MVADAEYILLLVLVLPAGDADLYTISKMCGIWAVFGLQNNLQIHCRSSFFNTSHRGPDAWRIEYDNALKNCCIGFHRLTIVDGIYGMQPMKLHEYPRTTLVCNAEIYNCKRLSEEHGFKYETFSDVECIIHLYQQFGIETCVKSLDGVFAICIVDAKNRKVLLGRDPYGVRPLFRLLSSSGILAICSEAKGLVDIAEQLENGEGKKLEPFLPGTFEEYDILENGTVKLVKQGLFHRPGDKPSFQTFVPYEDLGPDCLENIRKIFTMAVRKRLMAEKQIGCLLSGGLDSSLAASMLVKEAKRAKLPYKIQSFTIGTIDSPDIVAAREVAKFIGTEHHEVIFTEEDVATILDDAIYQFESPDVRTVRDSVLMMLVSKYIKENTGNSVVFSGEGSDELTQGYIYFKDAPTSEEGHQESLRLLRELYLFDGLRADRSVASQSLELRVPFLDLQFTHYYLSLPKEARQPKDGVEKHLLRSAFDKSDLLPHHILWRPKEAFSDGATTTAKSIVHILQEIVDKKMPEKFDPEKAALEYPHCTPMTKEGYYYRRIFEKSYPKLAKSFIPFYWLPRWNNVSDPSPRFISHYGADKSKPDT